MKRGQVYDPSRLKITRCGCSIDMRGTVIEACHWHVGDERPWAEQPTWVWMLPLVVLIILVVVGFWT